MAQPVAVAQPLEHTIIYYEIARPSSASSPRWHEKKIIDWKCYCKDRLQEKHRSGGWMSLKTLFEKAFQKRSDVQTDSRPSALKQIANGIFYLEE